jgi:hypothetical protein
MKVPSTINTTVKNRKDIRRVMHTVAGFLTIARVSKTVERFDQWDK